MAFMKPYADYFAAYHVETGNGVSIVPTDVAGELMCLPGGFVCSDEMPSLAMYVDGEVQTAERREPAWYSRLSVDGYLDCTEWQGPYDTEEEALDACCDEYDCDENGDEIVPGEENEAST